LDALTQEGIGYQLVDQPTLFSAWIYDTLKPYAEQLLMGHTARMKAICSGKKKTDRLDARTIADLLRCNLLPIPMRPSHCHINRYIKCDMPQERVKSPSK
jgi:hypothetical protein